MTPPVDVIHVVPAYHPVRGGIEILVESLIDAASTRRGFRSAVLSVRTRPEQPTYFEFRGTPVHTVDLPTVDQHPDSEPSKSQQSEVAVLTDVRRILSTVRSTFASQRPRLVHLHSPYGISPLATSVATSLNIPIIHHLHGLLHPEVGPGYFRSIKEAQWVCAVSGPVADSVRQFSGRLGQIHVIRNGLVDPYEGTQPFDARSPTVAMIGRFTSEKGFSDGLAALAIVKDHIPDLIIRFVGVGPERNHLLRKASELGLVESIQYFGEQSHPEALRIMAGVDVVLVPSTRVEGFSLVAAEAALIGKPVVATMVGGLSETIIHESTGLLVPPGDTTAMAAAVCRLVSDQGLSDQIGTRARRHALAAFDHGRFIDEITDLYSRVLADHEGH